jgi:hypothetical protein
LKLVAFLQRLNRSRDPSLSSREDERPMFLVSI